MGNRSSSSSTLPSSDVRLPVPVVCPFCAISVQEGRSRQVDADSTPITLCKRCGVALMPSPLSVANPQAPASPNTRRIKGQHYNAMENDEKDSDLHAPLLRVYLRPFESGLSEDQKAMGEGLLGETRMTDEMRPILEQVKGQIFTRGQIISIQRSNSNSNSNSTTSHHAESLPPRPIEFKVVFAYPPSGIFASKTKVVVGKSLSHQTLRKIHVLPTAASIAHSKCDPTKIFDSHLKVYFTGTTRHCVQGELFTFNSVEFKVIACEPENGTVGSTSVIYHEGDPLVDLTKLHILPIYETLPNREKNISQHQLFERYLEPFFNGRAQFLTKEQVVQFDGVDFKVMATAEADSGLVTVETEIFAQGDPLRADELKRAQLEADEAMARALQREEAGRQFAFGLYGGGPMPVFVQTIPGPGGQHGGDPHLMHPDEVRMRLQALLRLMPPNERVQRLSQQLAMRVPFGAMDRNFLALLRAMNQNGADDGAGRHDIDALPTRTYKAKNKTQSSPPDAPVASNPDPSASSASPSAAASAPATPPAEKKAVDKEQSTCMVCLSEYENGDELRTLPCFHSYHKGCIDTWLMKNKKCPVCKTPIC